MRTSGPPVVSLLFLEKVLEQPEHAWPAPSVTLAGGRHLRQPSVGYSQLCSTRLWREFPADDGTLANIFLCIRNPAPNQKTRRIVFQHLAVAVKFAHTVYIHCGLLGVVTPAPTEPGFDGEGFDLALFAGPPSHYLLGINQCLKHALGWSGNVDFANHSVLIGSDCCSCHFLLLSLVRSFVHPLRTIRWSSCSSTFGHASRWRFMDASSG